MNGYAARSCATWFGASLSLLDNSRGLGVDSIQSSKRNARGGQKPAYNSGGSGRAGGEHERVRARRGSGEPEAFRSSSSQTGEPRWLPGRMGLAHNRSTPGDILSRLADSANEYTRGYVAANPNATADILATLSKDRIEHVRSSVAQNPSTPRSIIEVLLGDANETVRRLAADAMQRR